ncbi:MAG TPA: hypothetical protein VFV38_21565 [Ktedonobacteraceae bacterium]|nr:hypothetical protein [Ktedonobacteraceae bacterium]
MSIQELWASLEARSFPYLHELALIDRDHFVLLDAYLRDCLEEWRVCDGQLSARSIVLLDDCARSITRRFRLLDSEGQYYFGQFRRLARRILRGVDVEQAYRQAEQEMDAELDWKHAFDELLPGLAFSAEPSARGQ